MTDKPNRNGDMFPGGQVPQYKPITAIRIPGVPPGRLVETQGENPIPDRHTMRAAEIFSVTPEEVTKDQRGHAKRVNFLDNYGQRGLTPTSSVEDLSLATITAPGLDLSNYEVCRHLTPFYRAVVDSVALDRRIVSVEVTPQHIRAQVSGDTPKSMSVNVAVPLPPKLFPHLKDLSAGPSVPFPKEPDVKALFPKTFSSAETLKVWENFQAGMSEISIFYHQHKTDRKTP